MLIFWFNISTGSNSFVIEVSIKNVSTLDSSYENDKSVNLNVFSFGRKEGLLPVVFEKDTLKYDKY